MSTPSKETTLKSTLRYLEKKYGKGIVMKLGERQKHDIPVLSTGSFKLNLALGTNGLPYGRIIEVYGTEASGKTTLAMHAIAEAQKKGKKALLVDTEHAFDKNYAQRLGINVQELFFCQPDFGEQAFNIIEHCIRSEQIGIVVIDSVSALIPEAELKGEMSDHNVGGQARLMSKAMRKITAITSKTGTICLFINQIRHKIGVVFGSPETTPGGYALRFHASVRLEVRHAGIIKDREGNKIGQKTKVRIVKNKLAAPFKETILDVIYGKGISVLSEIIDISLILGLLKQAGAWISYGEQRIGQGREAVIQHLRENDELKNILVEKILARAKQ